MFSMRRLTLAAVASFGFALTGWSQGMMMRPPDLPGKFNPVVGSGAAYQMTGKDGQTHNWEVAVVGKESVDGQECYWVEMRINSEHGKMVVKELKVYSASGAATKRRIIQMAGQPPMEVPADMGMMGGGPAAEAGHAPGELGQLVGSESVTVPAGTFPCEHYRGTRDGKTTDVWLSSKVTPFGMIKMTGPDSSGVLQKVLDNQKSQIQGEPQKMQFPGMPR